MKENRNGFQRAFYLTSLQNAEVGEKVIHVCEIHGPLLCVGLFGRRFVDILGVFLVRRR